MTGMQAVLAHLKQSAGVAGLTTTGGRHSPQRDRKRRAAAAAQLLTQSINAASSASRLETRLSASTAVPTDVGEQGFDALSTADLGRGGVTWRKQATILPVGRGEAVILEAALDEALPDGAITAKYGSAAQRFTSLLIRQRAAGHQAAPQPALSPAQLLLEAQDMRYDFDMLDSVMREAARQVAASCAERGRLILKVCEGSIGILVKWRLCKQ
jgi:hypothetical protein